MRAQLWRNRLLSLAFLAFGIASGRQASALPPPLSPSCAAKLAEAIDAHFRQFPADVNAVYVLGATFAQDPPQIGHSSETSLTAALEKRTPTAILVRGLRSKDSLSAIATRYGTRIPVLYAPGVDVPLAEQLPLLALGITDILGTADSLEDFAETFHQLSKTKRDQSRAVALRFGELGFVGVSPQSLRLFDEVLAAAQHRRAVLLMGPTGAGKEVIAGILHQLAPALGPKPGPFLGVNCARLSSALAAAELFGYEKGAFTGATGAGEGLVRLAGNGVLLLDEVHSLPLDVQRMLLRALEEKTGQTVGANAKEYPIHARIIAASNVPLWDLVQSGAFLPDLYYRLAQTQLFLAPLFTRREDIVLQALHFLHVLQPEPAKIEGFAPGVIEGLLAMPWHGNSRELRSEISAAIVRHDGHPSPLLRMADFSTEFRARLAARLSEQLAGRGGEDLPQEGPPNSTAK